MLSDFDIWNFPFYISFLRGLHISFNNEGLSSLFGSCCSNKWAALALECFLRALDPDWAPALMIGPYGTEASSSALDQGQRQQEIEEVFPTEAEASYSA